MTLKLLKLSLISLLTLSSLYADESADLDGFGGDLDGFSDTEISVDQETLPQEQSQSNYTLSGNLAFKTSYGYRSHNVDSVDYSGFNQAQASTYLQFDAKLSDDWKVRISGDAFYDAIYDLHPSNNYNQDTLDTYKTQLRLDDTYIQGRLTKDIDIKIGRQIVVWGKSDSIRITDVINPLDNRLPGMTDIKDLRLSTSMAKFDYYIDSWNFSAMAIFESRIFLEAAPRSEFFPVDSIFPIAPNPFIDLVQPSNSLDDMQFAFAANGIFSGWDLSFYAADVLDSKWHMKGTNPSNMKRVVSKIQMVGSAINVVRGSWLFKSEVAYMHGIKYNSTADAKNRLDVLVGFDYMGIKDTLLSIEIANRHIFEHEDSMSDYNAVKPDFVDKNELQTALRASRSFQNDTINANALVSMFGASWEYGGFARVWVEYELMNSVNANFGVVDYISGDKPFTAAISDNDRVFADITYSF